MRQPDFFIVGAPKCGTTAMDEYLKQHPEIFMSETKELHFFGKDLKFNCPRITREQYLSHFSKAKMEKRIGEASVWYLHSKTAAREIREFCPSASIIIMLRNPVDMLYSLHSQLLYTGDEDIADFEAALNAESDRKRGLRIPQCMTPVSALFYRDVVKYTEQVQRYLDVFGQDNVHIIVFDEFKKNTPEIYRKTLRFLGVNPDFQPDFQVVNPNKIVRSKTLRSLLLHRPKIVKWLGNTFMSCSLRDGLLCLLFRFNARYMPRPSMDSALKQQLVKDFVPEVEKLSHLLNRDLTYWNTLENKYTGT